MDIEVFMLISIEIRVGHPPTQSGVSNGDSVLSPDVPLFVPELLSTDQSADRRVSESFNNICDFLKDYDSAEVLKFVT
jgi:hypothetical protein